MIPKKPALGLDPGVGTGFRKRSCSNKRLERDEDSKKSHRALAAPRRLTQRDTEPTGQILYVLPGDAARSRAAGSRPFERLAPELLSGPGDAKMRHIAFDH